MPATQIFKFVNYADLFRIKGIAGQTTELFEAAGVNTVAELVQRNPANLAAKLKEANAIKKVTGKVPTETQVGEWIEAAKTLPKKVTYLCSSQNRVCRHVASVVRCDASS